MVMSNKIRVLIVEDDPDVRMIVAEILRSKYEILTAQNGLEALDRLSVYEPDIVVMDLMMPVMDGIDTTRAIKKDAHFAEMPILFLTARKDNESVRSALLAGADVFLEKPFDPAQLLSSIRDLINLHRITPKAKQYSPEDAVHHFSDFTPPENAGGTNGVLSSDDTKAKETTQSLLRVLLVDKNSEVIRTVRTRFKNRFEVIATSDCELVLDKIIAYQPDVLVMEGSIPHLDAENLALLGRINKKLRARRFVLYTEIPENYTMDKASKPGVDDILAKPFDIDLLDSLLVSYNNDPSIPRSKKRLEYREILRRENPTGE